MKKVIAIIVTYNRLGCLKECIDALYRQTYRDFDILVINNGSTDGTKEFLDSNPALLKIHQENLGGAGGFYSGMKYMYEHEYDWLWMMDDDGLPHPDQLNHLLSIAGGHKNVILNALVVNKESKDHFAFGHQEPINTVDLKADIIDSPFSPFNGTFIPRHVIERIGLIKKEMFIWGDEQEYMHRARSAGFQTFTVPSAIHYHPREKGMKALALPFIHKGEVLIKPSAMSHYFYRNLGYIDFTYRRNSIVKTIICYTLFFTRKLLFSELVKFYKYYYRGAKNRY